jgi:hypothetical protein
MELEKNLRIKSSFGVWATAFAMILFFTVGSVAMAQK